MISSRIHGLFGAAILTLLCLSLPSAAHEGATGLVKERMDAMEGMAKAMKAITQAIKGGRDFASIRRQAQIIHDLAEKMTPLFPAGSPGHASDAKPIIWKQWPDFETRARALTAESEKLAAIEASDTKALGLQVRVVSQTCGGCHEVYRQRHK
jgi:cytochrome c556